MTVPYDPTRPWQLAFVVPDLEAAMDQLTQTLGLTWTGIKTSETLGPPRRVTFSEQGPPYFELVEPLEGAGEARLDHLAFWAPDLAAESARLHAAGAALAVDGQADGLPINFHDFQHVGFRAEVFDVSAKDMIRERRGFDDVG